MTVPHVVMLTFTVGFCRHIDISIWALEIMKGAFIVSKNKDLVRWISNNVRSEDQSCVVTGKWFDTVD